MSLNYIFTTVINFHDSTVHFKFLISGGGGGGGGVVSIITEKMKHYVSLRKT